MAKVSRRIRKILIDSGLITGDDWTVAQGQGGNPLETLLRNEALSEGKLLSALGNTSGVAPIDLTRVQPDANALECIPQAMCTEFGICPISLNGKILTIAVSDPFDIMMLDDLRARTRCQIEKVLSHPTAIKQALEGFFQTGARQVDELLDSVDGDIDLQVKEEAEDLEISTSGDGEDAPAVKLINLILLRALKEKASDIHIEPLDKCIRVRYRVDGLMSIVMTPPKGLLNALISRIKILSQLDIAERFVPQDGKFQIRFEGRTIDFRVSILPMVGGEKAVIRILDGAAAAMTLDNMGYEDSCLADLRKAVSAAYGMLLVTGPTGSGKSTTLYSCVREVSTPEINVVTVEDPVEYRMEGVNQVPVNPKRGMTFSGALRSILRQDPDVVLVGEIRDTETANIAIKAALTGHLVLSTLHTNDAASTITRLVDMGVDPFMVSSSLLCICAQRLARKLCDSCRQPLEVPTERLLPIGFTEEQCAGLTVYQPKKGGCPRCKDGYRGRFAILETLYLHESLKRMVVQGRSVHELKTEAIGHGMQTLRQVGIENVIRGKTSIEEVLRVTLED